MPEFNAPPSFRFPRPKPPPPARSPTRIPNQASPRPQTPHAQHGRRRRSGAYRDNEEGAVDLAPAGQRDLPRTVEFAGRIEQHHEHDEQMTGREDEDMLDWNHTSDTSANEAAPAPRRQHTPTSAQPKRRRLDATPGSGVNENNERGFPRPTLIGRKGDNLKGGRAAATPTFNAPRTFRAVMPPPSSSTPARRELGNAGMNASTSTAANLPPPPLPSSNRPRFLPLSTSSNFSSIDTSASPSHHSPFLLHPSNSNTNTNHSTNPAPPAPPATALPDIFSPHKRKQQRYLPGGFADQVRGWLLDVGAGGGVLPAALADAGAGSDQGGDTSMGGRRESRGGQRDGQEEVHLEMMDVCTAAAGGGVGSVAVGVARAAGTQAQVDKSVRILLVGQGGGAAGNELGGRVRGGRGLGLKPGGKVVVGMPAWEIEVEVDVQGGVGGDEQEEHEQNEEEEALERQEEKETQTWVICPVWRAA